MTAVIEEITDVDPTELDDVFARWLNQVPLLETLRKAEALACILRTGGSRRPPICVLVYDMLLAWSAVYGLL